MPKMSGTAHPASPSGGVGFYMGKGVMPPTRGPKIKGPPVTATRQSRSTQGRGNAGPAGSVSSPSGLSNSQIQQGVAQHLTDTYIRRQLTTVQHGLNAPPVAQIQQQINVGGQKGAARPIDRSEAAKRGWQTRRSKQGRA